MPTSTVNRIWPMRLLASCGAMALGACGGGFGCGDTGLGPCGSAPPLYVAIDVAAADFSGNGHPDVVLPVSQGVNVPGEAAVFMHAASAGKTYQQAKSYSLGVDFPSRVVAADLDGDGHPDLLMLNAGSAGESVAVLLGNAGTPGTFRSAQTLSVPYPNDAAVADLDGDGRADLILAGNALMVAMQKPGTPGSFSTPTSLFSTTSAFLSVAVADLDGDGTPDVVAADVNTVTALFLAPGGTQPAVRQAVTVYHFPPPAPNTGQNAVAIADLDGDGRADIVVVDPIASKVAVILQSHTVAGEFLPPVTYSLPANNDGMNRLMLADLDGDGHTDLVIAASDAVLVYLQDATQPGTFLPVSSYPAPLGADGVAVADIDGDGLSDIVIQSGVSASLGALSPPGVLYQDRTRPGRFLPVQDLQIQ